MADKYQLKLFIAGPETLNTRFISTLTTILDSSQIENNYDLTVINILEQPEQAKDANIIATPTLVKLQPEPVRKLFGNLTHKASLLMGLEIQ